MRFFFRRLLPAAKTAIRLRGRLLAISRKCDSSSRLVHKDRNTPRGRLSAISRKYDSPCRLLPAAKTAIRLRGRLSAISRKCDSSSRLLPAAKTAIRLRGRLLAISRKCDSSSRLVLRQYDGSLSSIDKKTQPEGLRLTNPPKWGLLRCNILRQAIERRRSLDPLDARRFFRTYRFTRRSRWAIQIAARLVCAF